MLVALVVLAAFAGVGCRRKPAERLAVAVSIAPVFDLAARIAGPDADVSLLSPSGSDPRRTVNTTELDAATSRALVGKRFVVLVGLGLDAHLEQLVEHQVPRPRLLKIGERVPTLWVRDGATASGPLPLPGGDATVGPTATHANDAPGASAGAIDAETAPDPCVWMDPSRTRLMAKAMAEEFARADAPHALAYRRRAADVDAALEVLERDLESLVLRLRSRTIASYDGSLAYFADRYGMTLAARLPAQPAPPPLPYVDRARTLLQQLGRPPLAADVPVELGAAPAVASAASVHLIAVPTFGWPAPAPSTSAPAISGPGNAASGNVASYEELMRAVGKALQAQLAARHED